MCTLKWYELCYFREQKINFPFNKEILGCALGPAKDEGNKMAQWAMKGSCNVMPRQTLRLLNVEELNNETEIRSCKLFDSMIERGWGLSIKPQPETTPNDQDTYEEYEEEDEKTKSLPEIEETVDVNGTLIDQQPAQNRTIIAEVQLNIQDHITTGKVKRRVLGCNDRKASSYHDNPMLNSTVYEVEFLDGKVKEYAGNVIAKNMLTQVDFEEFTTTNGRRNHGS
eukprot:15335063-Ditylum_brightwellii.AAC.1